MNTADFYDQLEPYYELIYPDWRASIERQGEALALIIRDRWGDAARSVLDATAGIGTQALGLASRGFDVTASDISPRSIARLRSEADAHGLPIVARVGDVRRLAEVHDGEFDIVISCDNALPHLPSDEVLQGLRQMHDRSRPGGGCLISVRDYAAEQLTGIQLHPYGVRELNGTTFVAFQVWDCRDDSYQLTMYFVKDDGESAPTCHAMRTTYYPITTERLADLMRRAGFVNVERLDGIFFQPVLVGDRGGRD